MEQLEIDMRPTYYRRSGLPEGLQRKPGDTLPQQVIDIIEQINNGTYEHQIIFMSGPKRGKTTAAASIARAWIEQHCDIVTSRVPALFVPVHQLCYQNRTVDRYQRDEALNALIRDMSQTDMLILDGVFGYLTQNDDLLLQAIYDARQHSLKTTIVTTSLVDPLSCASSVLYRIARDANIKVVF